MPDNVAFLVFFQEIRRTWKGDLWKVALRFVMRQTNAFIPNRERFCFLVNDDFDARFANLTRYNAAFRERLQFCRGIHRIWHQFPKENLLVTVQEFLDNRKDILRLDWNIACYHTKSDCFSLFFILKLFFDPF